jgi:hypothetical protein
MQNNYRYFMNSVQYGSREIFPLGEGSAEENFAPITDFISDYRREISGTFKIVSDDFNWLYNIEKSPYRCEKIPFVIQKKCFGNWVNWFEGQVFLSDCTFDPERCEATFKIEAFDDYTCIEEKKEEEIEVFSLVSDRKIMKTIYPGTVLEYVTYSTTVIATPFVFWGGPGLPKDGGWIYYKSRYTFSGGIHTNESSFVRELRTVDCLLNLGEPWIFISEVCPGTGKVYARNPILYNFTNTRTFDGSGVLTFDLREFSIFGTTTGGMFFDNGMKIADVLSALLLSCGLTPKSDFFQINPDNPSSTNYVTSQVSKINNLLVFQKSDIKRPDSSGNATQCLITLENFIEGLCKLFNCKYKIEGSFLRIEHVSRFNRSTGSNYIGSPFMRYKNSYTYDKSKLPKRETFLTREFARSTDFEGRPIFYDTNCAIGDNVEITVEKITTDILHCLNNSASDSPNVADSGIVIAATELFDDEYVLLSEPSILANPLPNNPLGWSQLLRDFHKYDRPFSIGIMNGQKTPFFSYRPTKKGAEFSVPACCGEDFNPLFLITTLIGQGQVESASLNLRTGLRKFSLIYGFELVEASVPVANPDGVEIFKNAIANIDVLANDFIPGGLASLDSVEIFQQGVNGTASIIGNNVQYIPDLDFVGSDAIYYRIKDIFNNYSNVALIVVTVVDPAPIAVPDAFTVQNSTATLLNVMANDLPGQGSSITVFAFDALTAQGIAISVAPNGDFVYNSPAIAGVDSFSYTIRNDLNEEATTTVTITIQVPPFSFSKIFAKATTTRVEACIFYGIPSLRKTYYCNGGNFLLGNTVYKDIMLTETALPGFYSDGVFVYDIGATGQINFINNC